MVISGASEEERPRKFMAMAPERSRSLHNFSMPCLKWGNQKLLRCMKVNSNGEIPSVGVRSSASEAESEGFIRRTKQTESEKWRSSNGYGSFEKSLLPLTGASGGKSEIERDGDGGFAAIRAKLMFELRTAADKMKLVISEEGEEDDLSAKPWNLRTRRAGCKVPNETGRGGGGSKIEERKQNSSHPQTEISTIKSLRLRGLSPAREVEKKDSPKFSISLSREEVEDDFLSMTGTRPSRRPKKRARIIQKQLDTIFPGLWLSEVTPDSYKVFEIPETGKR